MFLGLLVFGNIIFIWNDLLVVGVNLLDGDVLVEVCFDVLIIMSSIVVFFGILILIEIIDGDEMEVFFNSVFGVIIVGVVELGEFSVIIFMVEVCNGINFCFDFMVIIFINIENVQFSIIFLMVDMVFM